MLANTVAKCWTAAKYAYTLIAAQTVCAAIKVCICNGVAYYWRLLERTMKAFVPPVELMKRAHGFAATAVPWHHLCVRVGLSDTSNLAQSFWKYAEY